MRFPRAESEPSPKNISKPESEPPATAEYYPRHPNAEPVPEWPAAKYVWKGAWELHYIGFGIMFLLVAFWSILALIRARNTKLLVTRRFCYAVNCLLVVFGITRALSLFLYPYEMVDYGSGTPIVIQRLFFGSGFPCLIAGYTLIHYAFLEAAKVSFSRRKIQSLRFILGVIVVHVILVLVAEIVTSYVANTSVLVIICMLYFIICALAVSASVFYSGVRVMKESKTHRRTLKRMSVNTEKVGSTKKATTYSTKASNTKKVARVTLVTALLGVMCAALQIYALVGVFKVRLDGKTHPDPWLWWVYVSIFRLIELGLAVTMAYTVAQPKKGGINFREFAQCCLPEKISRKETYTDSGVTITDSATRGSRDDETDQNFV